MLRADRIIILGGGWSVSAQEVDVDALRRRGLVVGVNDGGTRAKVDEVVSMDRLWMESRWPLLETLKVPTHLRQSAFRVNLKKETLWPGVSLFENDHEADILSEKFGRLDGFNSGFCALNLAFQRAPKEVYLFGFDHCRGPNGHAYWFNAYPWVPARGGTSDGKYVDWSKKFKNATAQFLAADIKVFNVSPQSALTNFPKISYSEFKKQCAI